MEMRFWPGLGLASGYIVPGCMEKLWPGLGSSLVLPWEALVILCSLVVSSVMGSNLCEGDSGDPKALEKTVSAGLL